MNKKPEKPEHPYVWVLNDTAAGVRALGDESQVRYKVGPAHDSDKYCTRAIYVHVEDLRKFKKWLKGTGQLAEASWCQEIIEENL